MRKPLQLGVKDFEAIKHLVLVQVERCPLKLDLDISPYLPRATVESMKAQNAAKFPATKSLNSFDFKAIPKLNKMEALELARC